MTSAPDWPDGICSRRATAGVRLLSVTPNPPPCSSAGWLLLLLRLARAPCSASRSSSSMVTFSVLSCLFRRILTGTVVPGWVATTILTSSSRFDTGRPLN